MKFVVSEDTVWPFPGDDEFDELEWRLRYQTPDTSRTDALCAASVLSAYRALVALPVRERNKRIRDIRRGPRTPVRKDP